MFVVSLFIADFYDEPILINLTRLVALNLIFNSLCVVQTAILTTEINFKTRAKVSFGAAVLSGAVGICFIHLLSIYKVSLQ